MFVCINEQALLLLSPKLVNPVVLYILHIYIYTVSTYIKYTNSERLYKYI